MERASMAPPDFHCNITVRAFCPDCGRRLVSRVEKNGVIVIEFAPKDGAEGSRTSDTRRRRLPRL